MFWKFDFIKIIKHQNFVNKIFRIGCIGKNLVESLRYSNYKANP